MTNPTPKELAAMVEAMTPGEWQEDGIHSGLVNVWSPSSESHVAVVGDYKQNGEQALLDARGIVALRNHFAALMERHERMRAALDKIASWGDGPVVNGGFDNPADAAIARAALADADKPLESRS